MSIILKGIDLPKSCGGCEFNYCLEGGSYEWWECVILHDDINQFDTRRTDCPLVEIPTPHGRLIDADKIDYDEFWHREGQGFTIAVCQGAEQIIKEQPTILEAEETNER